MRRKTSHHANDIVRLWVLSMAVLVVVHANAAGVETAQENSGKSPEIQFASIPLASAKPTKYSANMDGKKRISPSGKLSLSLSLTLSVPAGASSQPGSQTKMGDAPQSELASKEKKLSDLYAQIAETEKLIQLRQHQLAALDKPLTPSLNSGGTNVAAGVIAQSAVISVPKNENAPIKPEMVASDIQQVNKEVISQPMAFEVGWIKLATGLAVLLFAALTIIWYRKMKAAHQGMPDSSKMPSDVFDDTELGQSSAINKTPASLPERTMKIPAYTQQKVQSILPPEYEMLEEADIYLRFGHDKLAEEALREAIKINPKNPQAYLTLSRICFSRGDKAAFFALANQLKPLGDANAWSKVAEMGRSLESNNLLYS